VVPQIDVPAGELHFLPRQPVEHQELHDMRDEDVAVRSDDVVSIGLNRDVHPVLEVVGAVLRIDGTDLSLLQERQSASNRRDLNGLKDAVQNQNMTVEHGDLPPSQTRAARFLFPEACGPEAGWSHDTRLLSDRPEA
jgi:hypothetical protein